MGVAQEVGDAGENFAFSFLIFKGFEILHKNWRTGKLEIDIIAKDGNKLVFVEVKSSIVLSEVFYPEDRVNIIKQKKIVRAAEKYLGQNPHIGPLRFDIVSVAITPLGRHLYYHPDAFFPMGT